MTLSCVIYPRYSSENQDERSIDDQTRICQTYAERECWNVVAVLPDFAISGATLLRPGSQKLLEMIRAREVDVVLAESLDRISRDQEHIAAFYKQARFAGVRIVTVAEGEITELHIGLKGTMSALVLKDLAQKTHRGLEGRVRSGGSAGGLSYGYRVVRRLRADGTPTTGEVEIAPDEAAVVVRIFGTYVSGQSPRFIARTLNAEGIPGPRGGKWTASLLLGGAGRETGLLRNRLYIGERVWNRQRFMKDPNTGRRIARPNPREAWVVTNVPELAIIDADLWEPPRRGLPLGGGSSVRPTVLWLRRERRQRGTVGRALPPPAGLFGRWPALSGVAAAQAR